MTQEKLEQLISYYKEKGLLIVGLNDSQGVNTTSTFFKKGLLQYMEAALTDFEFAPEIIDAFSLRINKTEHVDYILKHNLTLEEIKWMQLFSAITSFEKVMNDLGLPKKMGEILGNMYHSIYRVGEDDKDVRIASSIKEAKEPTLIYSSGANDLMRAIGANPFSIQRAYETRDIRPHYNYALEKINNPQTLTNIMDAIRRNYEHILGINDKTDIYTLGAYVPASLRKEGLKVFRDLVLSYNEALQKVCLEYGTVYINTGAIGNKYNQDTRNFHISVLGHNALAHQILEAMYEKKILGATTSRTKEIKPFVIGREGALGVKKELFNDCIKTLQAERTLCGHASERASDVAEECLTDARIFQKVCQKIK